MATRLLTRANQALPEGIPLGQADGMSSLQIAWRVVGLGFYYSVFSTYNYDTHQFGHQHELVARSAMAQKAPFRFLQFESLQRRSPAVRDPRFDRRLNRDLAAIR